MCLQNNNKGKNAPICQYTYWRCSMSTVWSFISYIDWDATTQAPPQWQTDFWLLRMWYYVLYLELIADSPNQKTWGGVHLWNVWQAIWHTCIAGLAPKEMWILMITYVKLLYSNSCFMYLSEQLLFLVTKGSYSEILAPFWSCFDWDNVSCSGCTNMHLYIQQWPFSPFVFSLLE